MEYAVAFTGVPTRAPPTSQASRCLGRNGGRGATTAAAAAAAPSADERVSIAKPENPPLGRTLGPPERLRRSNSLSYLYGGAVVARRATTVV